MDEAIAILQQIRALPHGLHLPIAENLIELVAPFVSRLHGYRQVTDALLLGLAIRHKSVLVTLDRHVQALAGTEFQENLLVLTWYPLPCPILFARFAKRVGWQESVKATLDWP